MTEKKITDKLLDSLIEQNRTMDSLLNALRESHAVIDAQADHIRRLRSDASFPPSAIAPLIEKSYMEATLELNKKLGEVVVTDPKDPEYWKKRYERNREWVEGVEEAVKTPDVAPKTRIVQCSDGETCEVKANCFHSAKHSEVDNCKVETVDCPPCEEVSE